MNMPVQNSAKHRQHIAFDLGDGPTSPQSKLEKDLDQTPGNGFEEL